MPLGPLALPTILTSNLLLAEQYYLPDEHLVTHDFLKEVFAGQKALLLKAAVNHVQVPHYDELSVCRLWPEFKKDAEFMKYFPSKYPKDKGPPREYFFNILNTIHPEYLEKVMQHASK